MVRARNENDASYLPLLVPRPWSHFHSDDSFPAVSEPAGEAVALVLMGVAFLPKKAVALLTALGVLASDSRSCCCCCLSESRASCFSCAAFSCSFAL